MNQDKQLCYISGFGCIVLFIAIWLLTAFLFLLHSSLLIAIPMAVVSLSLFFCSSGFFINEPNQAKVVTFFGSYIGTAQDNGFFFTYPFTTKSEVSLKVVNIHTEKTKVNDAKGNPIEIAAVIVWKVASPYRAFFGVANYREFIGTQSDAAIRTIASHYPYDAHDDNIESLRGNSDAVSLVLQKMLQERLEVAGIEVIETRLSDLAYAPEIAQAMLKRQQAEAQVAARKYVIENAIVIVEGVLKHFEEQANLKLETAQKVQIINNLLIALVSEHDATPMINIGQ